MNVGDALVNLATAPLRIGLAATQVSLEVANEVIEVAKRATGEVPGVIGGSTAMVHMLGLDETVARAQRIAKLADGLLAEDAPLTQAMSPGGPVDRLLRPGGLLDRMTAPGGVLDRLTADGGGLDRALADGGLVDQLLDENGLVERLLAEDGLAERLLVDVWGYRDGSGARTVDSHVRALRRKLGDGVVRTVHGVGYALGEADADVAGEATEG